MVHAAAPSPHHTSVWSGRVGDACAAVAVLLGAGVFGGFVLLGPVLPASPLEFGAAPGVPPGSVPRDARPGGMSLGSFAGVLSTVVLAAAMWFRRDYPRTVFIGCAAVLCVALLWGVPMLGAAVATVIAAYAVAFRLPRSQMMWIVGCAAAMIALLSGAVTGWESVDWRLLQVGTAVIIAAALGDSAHSRQEYVTAMVDRAERAEREREGEVQRRVTEERLQIARDVHDTVAHRISVMNLQAGAAAAQLHTSPEQTAQSLAAIREAARGALEEIGQLLGYLRDADPGRVATATATSQPTAALPTTTLPTLTLPATTPPDQRTPHTFAPRYGVHDLPTLISDMEAAGLRVHAHESGPLNALPESIGAVVYRVLQESLTNAHKHGYPAAAVADLTVTDAEVHIRVSNPVASSGDAGATQPNGTGLGLIGLQERVHSVHGSVRTSHAAGRFTLDVTIPVPETRGVSA